MDKKEFMQRLEDVVHVCRTNDVTTEEEDGVLATARKMLADLPEPMFAAQAEPEPTSKSYESGEDPVDGLELYGVEIEWDYLKTIGVKAHSQNEALEIADDLDRLGIINPDPSCRIEGEEAKIVDSSEMHSGCPIYTAEDCKRPDPETRTEQDRFSDRLLGYDPLERCSRIAGASLTWQAVNGIWEQHEKTRLASELAYRIVNSSDDYYDRYAMIGRDICIGRVSPTEWFENAFGAYWDMPQFGEGFDEAVMWAWENSLPAEPQEGAQRERRPKD